MLQFNWRNVKYSEQKSSNSKRAGCGFPHSYKYDVNGDWIVQTLPHPNILVRNRWTLEIEKVYFNKSYLQCYLLDYILPTLNTIYRLLPTLTTVILLFPYNYTNF